MVSNSYKLPHPQSFLKGERSVNMMAMAKEQSGPPLGLGAVEDITRRILNKKFNY